LLSFNSTSLYFKVCILNNEEIEIVLIDITGISGIFMKYILPSSLENLTESLIAIIKLERNNNNNDTNFENDYNPFSLIISGNLDENNILIYIISLLWKNIVISGCIFELFKLISNFIHYFILDIE
jgi:hypothetical protein